jgi:NitT/TauT family transport system permease protein
VIQPQRTQDRRAEPEGSFWIDVVVFAFVLALVAVGVWFARRSTAAFVQTVKIELSWWYLPGYALQSFMRGLIAYVLSLIFTLVYGTVAAKSRRAERVLIPLLDVLQGIPVLGFLPALVLGMISIFPDSNLGLEIACVITIFTGQVWNMTFSFYGSIRAIPTELVEVAQVYHSSWWRKLTKLELPSSAIGLVWNSMVSMAGGWFFLMISEAFQLYGKDYRLPGLGSYMSVAYDQNDWWAVGGAIVAMVVVIVASDQLIWRPLVVWSQKFRIEDVDAKEAPRSFIFDFVRRSWFLRRLRRRKALEALVAAPAAARTPVERKPRPEITWIGPVVAVIGWGVAALTLVGSAYGAWKLVALLAGLPAARWLEIVIALGLTSLRTIAALVLATLWTVPVGVAIGSSPRLARRALGFVQVVASFPAPMLFPLLTVVLVNKLHLSFEWGCTLLTLFGAQWYVLFNVIAGTMSIPNDLREVAEVYRSRGWRRWKRLILPGIFPALLTGLITAAGGAWNAAIVTEYQVLNGRPIVATGLGSLISSATADPNGSALLGASIAVLTLTLVIVNRFVWKRLYRFSDERFALNR